MAREDLTGERIRLAFEEDSSGKRFEEFVRRLLEAERQRRFEPGTVVIDGPDKSGVPDGGKDCVVRVGARPLTRHGDHDLIADELGSTRYSAKSGIHWAKSIYKDVGYSGHLTGQGKDEPKSPPEGLLTHIAAGQRYVIVISSPTSDREPMLEKVRKALDHHMQRVELTPPPSWRDNIDFIDANTIASVIRGHAPSLPRELETKLGIDWPPELERFDEWTLRIDRELPTYVPDAQRERFIALLANPGDARVIRVFGPPGVGKTRLVHRALQRLDELELELDRYALSRPTNSVYYTQDPNVADRVTSSHWLRENAGAVILVADEVTSADANALASNFGRADARARLLLIGVSDEDTYEGRDREGVHGISLGELAEDSSRKLVAAYLSGDRPELVTRVLTLAEGYPYFAILLAKALDKDEDALEEGDDEAARWGAAKRVLAGSRREYGNNEVVWRDEATRRALCLLVVIMTGDRDLAWDDLWETLGDDLERIIAQTHAWERVKSANVDCVERGLLRTVGRSNKRYVSPANLARMILNHFFDDGPNDLGPRLARCNAGLQDRAHAMAKRFEASRRVRDKLSRALLAELQRRQGAHEPLLDLVSTRNMLYIAAERFPDATAVVLSGIILAHDRGMLAEQAQLRHALRGVFQELVGSRVSVTAFAELEAALFAMARVEDEPWANNATGIWHSLFLVALSQTHQPWAVRFGLLARRCREGSVDERVQALAGLARAAAADERGLGHAAGREWPRPNADEYQAHKREAWQLLAMLSESADSAVAAAARQTIAAELRGCIRSEIAIDAAFLQELGTRVEHWEIAQRRALAETLARIRRYDADDLDMALRKAIEALELHLRPSDFGERLVAQVGTWHPGPWPINASGRGGLEAAADEALVAEVLANQHELAAQWSWLASSAARRRRQFMRALGRLDTTRRFLPELEALAASTGHALLTAYVEGWGLVDDAQVDEWLAHQLAGGACEQAAVFVLPFLEPSDRRLAWLGERVEQGTADVSTLSALYPRWVGRTSVPVMLRLINACAVKPDHVHIAVELSAELLEGTIDDVQRERALDHAQILLVRATARRLSGSGEYDWERLLTLLEKHGRVAAALDGMLGLMTSDENFGMTPLVARCLHQLFERGHAEALWQRARAALEDDSAGRILWHLGHARLLAWVSADTILAWVGDGEARACDATVMVNPYGGELPQLARALLSRFGAEGRVAGALNARVFTTPGAVPSVLDFKRKQLANAEVWARDEVPAVRNWAERLAADLRESIADDEAHALFRRKLG